MRPPAKTTFFLSPKEVRALLLPLNGEGGFQSFGKTLQGLLQEDGSITLTDEQVGRVFRLARYAKGDGGFEGRMRTAFGRSLATPFIRGG